MSCNYEVRKDFTAHKLSYIFLNLLQTSVYCVSGNCRYFPSKPKTPNLSYQTQNLPLLTLSTAICNKYWEGDKISAPGVLCITLLLETCHIAYTVVLFTQSLAHLLVVSFIYSHLCWC